MLKPSPSGSSSNSSSSRYHKIFVIGLRRVGKTSLLDQLVYGGKGRYSLPTVDNTPGAPPIEDIYSCLVDVEERREKVHLFEHQGIPDIQSFNPENLRSLTAYADAIILVYAVNSRESYSLIELIKKSIDRLKEKKDIPILVLGNKVDKFRERQIETHEAASWAVKEKVRLVEVSATERSSILEPFIHLVSRLITPSGKSSHHKMSTKRTTSGVALEL